MKPRLTFEEHVEMGRALKSVRNELQHRYVQLANAYPRSGPEAVPAKLLHDALDAVEHARVELERALNGEHPEMAQPSVYYGDA